MKPTETAQALHHPVKDAFGYYLGRFHGDFCVADTAATAEWIDKPFSSAAKTVPERMQDDVQSMLDKYRQNTNEVGAKDNSATLPIMLVAFGKSYTPILGDFSRQMATAKFVKLDNDHKGRIFKLRVMQGSLRVQVVIIAHESLAVKSIMSQLCLYVADIANRRFYADYKLAGHNESWPVVIADTDIIPQDWQTDIKNTSASYVDFDLKLSIPLLITPKAGQPNDGLGTDGDKDDPHGFKMTSTIGFSSTGVV